MNMPFRGAKLALFFGDDLAVILRDDIPHIPFPNCWDFPGGGREGDEGPLACALRETFEELGVHVAPDAVAWGQRFEDELSATWFFVARLPAEVAREVRLGNEGQRWQLMTPQDYIGHPAHIPHFAQRLRLYLSGAKGSDFERPPAA